MKINETLQTRDGWQLIETCFDREQIITSGSNFLLGNGYLGYRGTFPDYRKGQFTACIVTDTYDNADGKWRELCNVPNGLFLQLHDQSHRYSPLTSNPTAYERTMDLKRGVYGSDLTYRNGVRIREEKFSSLKRKELLTMRLEVSSEAGGQIHLTGGIDGDVWSLNGDHFASLTYEQEGDLLLATAVTREEQTVIVVGTKTSWSGKATEVEGGFLQTAQIDVHTGATVAIEQYAAIFTSNDVEDPRASTINLLRKAAEDGYDALYGEQEKAWGDYWDLYNITLTGDVVDQVLVRFNLYHNIIATPVHKELPIGARGLSCQAYQGAAFWDQEIFNAPMFLYTNPKVVKNILSYRVNTLAGAKEKAEKLGYRGAFYPWISGRKGVELCPDFFFIDVLSGRKIRNHFNDWQIHISPDIGYALWQYYEATGDWSFIVEKGAEMLFEIAVFLMSRAHYNVDRSRYEYIRLLGPDEYHENVDNNVFTNKQAHFVLDKALYVYERMRQESAGRLQEIEEKVGLTEREIEVWQDMRDHLFLRRPDGQGVIEQFDGYFDLERIAPSALKERLQDPGEYWGWPNGIAVFTQVIKQADVIQMMVLHDEYDTQIVKANYDYYEPLTEHGSSLSPSMYSIIASQIGYDEESYRYFRKSATIDLLNTNKAISGGTFIGGIHTAACGALWQMMVYGFAGVTFGHNAIALSPRLPEQWETISFKLRFRDYHLYLSLSHRGQEITVLEKGSEPLALVYEARSYPLMEREQLKL